MTIERQSILINGQLAGFVEVLVDREAERSEARIWLYPQYRSLSVPVRKWVERTRSVARVAEAFSPGMEIAVFAEASQKADSEILQSEWSVGIRQDRRIGFEVFLTDHLTGFIYPIHTSKNR